MKTANFPRAAVMNVAGRSFPFPVSKDDWLISICDRDVPNATIAYPFDKVLFMQFDDVSEEGPAAITAEQAKEIATFIIAAREQQKNVWVNCFAGICRSGAIVSLLGDLGWEIVKHAESPGRIPNSLVYNRVRVHFEELRNSWEQEPRSGCFYCPYIPDIWVAAEGW